MADSPSTPPSKDLGPVFSTLRFIHRTKRLHQLTLRHSINARKQHERTEAAARRHIKSLNLRIQREIDAHPEIVGGIEDWGD